MSLPVEYFAANYFLTALYAFECSLPARRSAHDGASSAHGRLAAIQPVGGQMLCGGHGVFGVDRHTLACIATPARG